MEDVIQGDIFKDSQFYFTGGGSKDMNVKFLVNKALEKKNLKICTDSHNLTPESVN